MCRIVTSYIVCVAAVLSMATKVSVANDWLNATLDGRWDTAANWSQGVVPTMTPDVNGNVNITPSGTGSNACVLDGTMSQAVCQWLHINGELKVVAGGRMGEPIWGPGETFLGENGDAVITIDGNNSHLRSEAWHLGATGTTTTIDTNYPGTCTVNVTNGGMMTMVWWGNWIGPKSTINLINGTLRELGDWGLLIAKGGKIIMSGKNALIQFQETQVYDANEQFKLLTALVAAGKIVSNSPRCTLVVADRNHDLAGWATVRVTGCPCTTFAAGDFNLDCYVDFRVFAGFAGSWLSCIDPTDANCL